MMAGSGIQTMLRLIFCIYWILFIVVASAKPASLHRRHHQASRAKQGLYYLVFFFPFVQQQVDCYPQICFFFFFLVGR